MDGIGRRATRRWDRSRLVAAIVVVAAILGSTVACGRAIEFGDLRIGLPAPDPGPVEPDAGGMEARLAEDREAALDELIERLVDPAHEPTGEVVLRLSLTGGWGLSARPDLHLSIEDDGRVVRVTDTSVYASTRDFTSLRLSPDGVVRILGSVRPLLAARSDDLDGGAGVSPSTDRSAWLEVGPDITRSMDRIGQTDGYSPGQQVQREVFAKSIDGLSDLGWLGDEIVDLRRPGLPRP